MKILGLDMSTHTGYCVVSESSDNRPELKNTGLIESLVSGDSTNPLDIFMIADSVTSQILGLVDIECPDFIYIEQTNAGSFRWSQKQLEFIHCLVLQKLYKYHNIIRFVDTSAWRSTLKIRLSKEQRKHNLQVRQKKVRGKVTTKHLAVQWANSTFNLSLKLKDNDIADAIAVAVFGFNRENHQSTPQSTDQLINSAFNL